jgi:hypothetical protein
MTACKNNNISNLKVFAAAKQIELIRKEIKLSGNEPERARLLQKEIENIGKEIRVEDIVDAEAAATLKKVYGSHFPGIKVIKFNIWYLGNNTIEEADILYPNGIMEKSVKKMDEYFNTISQKYIPISNQMIFPIR